MIVTVLEWLAFGGSLLSVWMYGKHPTRGPVAGMAVAVTFMVYGIVAGVYAAALSNIVFFVLHNRNYRKGKNMDWAKLKSEISKGFRAVQDHAHRLSSEAGWWDNVTTEQQLYDIIPTKLCLIHSEVSEAMEGHRKGLPDDKLPHYSMFAVELADAVIRIGDLAGKCGIDLGPIIAEKMEFNASRPDHRRENRAKDGGKKY